MVIPAGPKKEKKMETVTLKNGTEVPESVALNVMIMLRHLHADQQPIFREFVLKCRNPKHRLSEQVVSPLRELGLIADHEAIDEHVRNVVLSSVIGGEEDLRILSPIRDNV